MNKTPRVFLAEPNRKFDFDGAKKFGSLINLSEDFLNIFDLNKTSEMLNSGFSTKKFDYENDFICMTGNSVILAVLLATATSKFPSVRLLIFDSRQSIYCERVFTVSK